MTNLNDDALERGSIIRFTLSRIDQELAQSIITLRAAYAEVLNLKTRYFPSTPAQTEPDLNRLNEKLAEYQKMAFQAHEQAETTLAELHQKAQERSIRLDEYNQMAKKALQIWDDAWLENTINSRYQAALIQYNHNLARLKRHEEFLSLEREVKQLWEEALQQQSLGMTPDQLVNNYYEVARDKAKTAFEKYKDEADLRKLSDEAEAVLQEKRREFNIRQSFLQEARWGEMLALYEGKPDDEIDTLYDEKGNVKEKMRVSAIRQEIRRLANDWARRESREALNKARAILDGTEPEPEAAWRLLEDHAKWQAWLTEAGDMDRLEKIITETQDHLRRAKKAANEVTFARQSYNENKLVEAWEHLEAAQKHYHYVSDLRSMQSSVLESVNDQLQRASEQAKRHQNNLELEEGLEHIQKSLANYPQSLLTQSALAGIQAVLDSQSKTLASLQSQLRTFRPQLDEIRAIAEDSTNANTRLQNFKNDYADILERIPTLSKYREQWQSYQDTEQLVRSSQGVQKQIEDLEKFLSSPQANFLMEVDRRLEEVNTILQKRDSQSQSQDFQRLGQYLQGRKQLLQGQIYFENGVFDEARAQLETVRQLHPPDASAANHLLEDIRLKEGAEQQNLQILQEAQSQLNDDPKRAWEMVQRLQFVNSENRIALEHHRQQAKQKWFQRIETEFKNFSGLSTIDLSQLVIVKSYLEDLKSELRSFDEQAHTYWEKRLSPLLAIGNAQRETVRGISRKAIDEWRKASLDSNLTEDHLKFIQIQWRKTELTYYYNQVEAKSAEEKNDVLSLIEELSEVSERWSSSPEAPFWQAGLYLELATRPENTSARSKEAYSRDAHRYAEIARKRQRGDVDGDDFVEEATNQANYRKNLKQDIENLYRTTKALQNLLPDMIQVEEWMASGRNVDDFDRAIRQWEKLPDEDRRIVYIKDWWAGLTARVEEIHRQKMPSSGVASLKIDQIESLAKLLILSPNDPQYRPLLDILPNQTANLAAHINSLGNTLQAGLQYGSTGKEILENQNKAIEKIEQEVDALFKILHYFAKFDVQTPTGTISVEDAMKNDLIDSQNTLNDLKKSYGDFALQCHQIKQNISQAYTNIDKLSDANEKMALVHQDFHEHRYYKELQDEISNITSSRSDLLTDIKAFNDEYEAGNFEKALALIEKLETQKARLEKLTLIGQLKGGADLFKINSEFRNNLDEKNKHLGQLRDWARPAGSALSEWVKDAYDKAPKWEELHEQIKNLSQKGAFRTLEKVINAHSESANNPNTWSYHDAVEYLSKPFMIGGGNFIAADVEGRYQEAIKAANEKNGKLAAQILEKARQQYGFYKKVLADLAAPEGQIYLLLLVKAQKEFAELRTSFLNTIKKLGEINPKKTNNLQKLVTEAEETLLKLYGEAHTPLIQVAGFGKSFNLPEASQTGLCPLHPAKEQDRKHPKLLAAKTLLGQASND